MIAIVDYKAGNLGSVRRAFERLGAPVLVTSQPACILEADHVVFPGVGSAGAAMGHLRAMGLIEPLHEAMARGTPFLGICLGAQILFERSEEDGGVDGLGFLPGAVRRFRPVSPADKVPQIGWNTVHWRQPHPLFAGLASGSEFYFVHSYYPAPSQPERVLAETEYAGVRFASAVGRGCLAATQFHPEKSGRIGLRLLANFAAWAGDAPAARGPDDASIGSPPC